MLTLNVQHVLRVQRRFRRNGDCGENTWERVTAVANDAVSASPDLQQAELAQLDDLDQRVIVKMNIMGTAVDVSMTAAQAAKFRLLQQAGAAEKKRRVDKARTAIKRYDWAPNEPRRKAALRAIDSCSLYASSENRLTCVLSLTELAPPEIFWPALMEAWSGCDATWNDRHYLLAAMKNAAIPATAFLSRAQRNFFDALPPRIVIFRRCSRSRVRAVSWTTDQKVAEDFASGHRNIPVPNPVLAAAVISKEHIFFVTDDRNEKEVILNPRRLRKLMIEPYTPRSHT